MFVKKLESTENVSTNFNKLCGICIYETNFVIKSSNEWLEMFWFGNLIKIDKNTCAAVEKKRKISIFFRIEAFKTDLKWA